VARTPCGGPARFLFLIREKQMERVDMDQQTVTGD
jgi:hypothetical protein